jgi:4'-phosphopantetheinyl transferase EntD
VGSLTHCEGFCAAVAAPAALVLGLGLDAETADPLPGQTPRHVCRPDELARFERVGPPPGSTWPKLAFCAKEAFYKCYRPLTGRSLGFDDVSVWFVTAPGDSSGAFRITVEAPGKAAGGALEGAIGRWRIADGRVHAGVTLAAHPVSARPSSHAIAVAPGATGDWRISGLSYGAACSGGERWARPTSS